MQHLDFLSGPPIFYFLEKKSNKTIFGGILSLFIIIIMLIISAAYIYEYAISNSYTYESVRIVNYTSNLDEQERILYEDKYTQNLTFDVGIENDDFIVYKRVNNNYSFPEKNHIDVFNRSHYIFNEVSNAIRIYVVYKCGKDGNCSSFYDLIKNGKLYYGQINVAYPRKIINHTASVPVTDDNDKKEDFISVGFTNDLDYYIKRFEWEVIIYKDQKSLLDSLMGNNKEYIFGHFKNERPETEKLNLNINKLKTIKVGDNYYLIVTESLFSYNQNFEYLLYRRKALSFLDEIGNISALFSPIKMIFSIIFSLYSGNFDNYTLLENVLDPKRRQKQIIPKELVEIKEKIQEIEIEEVEIVKEKRDLTFTGRSKTESLINKSDENKETEKKKLPEKKKKVEPQPQPLPPPLPPAPITLTKICCCFFMLNNCYSKCCCGKIDRQEKINLINNIIQKYMSYDSLLYNQILLENLFMDYKWNDDRLSYVQTNEMLSKLNPI